MRMKGSSAASRIADLEILNHRQQRPPPPQRVGPGRLVLALSGLISTFALGYVAGRMDVADSLRPDAVTADDQPSALLEASRGGAADADRPGTLDVSGRIVVRRTATVSSTYTARLKALHVQEGDLVQAGQVVAELDAAEADAAFAAASGRLAQVRALEQQALASRSLSDRQLSRAEALARGGNVTQARLDELRSTAASMAAAAAAAHSALEVAQAEQQSAAIVRQRLVIRAPFTGVVSDVSAEIGEVVSPASAGGGFVRTGILTLLDLDSRELEVFVPERHVGRIHPGTKGELRLEALPSETFAVTTAAVASEVDAQRGAVKIRMSIDNLSPKLLPNMSVTVRLNVQQ